jgi:hypothetical protein
VNPENEHEIDKTDLDGENTTTTNLPVRFSTHASQYLSEDHVESEDYSASLPEVPAKDSELIVTNERLRICKSLITPAAFIYITILTETFRPLATFNAKVSQCYDIWNAFWENKKATKDSRIQDWFRDDMYTVNNKQIMRSTTHLHMAETGKQTQRICAV